MFTRPYHQKRGVAFGLVVFLSLALSFWGFQDTYAVDGISVSGQATYVEQGDPVAVSPELTVTSAYDFAGKYVEASLDDYDSGETLSLVEDAVADVTAGAVSIVDGQVHLGDGTATEIVGQVDATHNGSAGTLRVNFTSSFSNADFEGGTTTGWTLINSRINLGIDSIAGYTTVDTTYYGSNRCGITNDNASVTGNFSGSKLIASSSSSVDVEANGNYFLQLVSTGVSGPGGYVTHGPAVYSDEFSVSQGQTLSFDWKAAYGSDNYHVYAALLSVDTNPTSRWTEILDATGSTSNWATASVVVPFDGQFRFVFVSGTDDYSCGGAAGASLYIDNVSVQSDQVSASVAQGVLSRVAYSNSSDNPNASDIISFSALQSNDVALTADGQVNITPVDDAPTLNTSPSVTYINTAVADAFPISAGDLDASDPDGDVMVLSSDDAVDDSLTDNSITYDKKISGTLADVWFQSTSLAYAVVPNDDYLNTISEPETEVFNLNFSDAGSTNPFQVTVLGAYDMKAGAPDLLEVRSTVADDQLSISYEIEFDEYVSGFTSDDITLAGTSGGSGWAITEPQLVPGSTVYELIASNSDPANGTVSIALTVSGIKDFADNQLSSATPTTVDQRVANIDRAPVQSLGSIALSGPQSTAIYPDYTLDAHGGTIYGAQITVADSSNDFVTGDALGFSTGSTFGNIAIASNSAGVLTLSSSDNSATEAQWQAAIRSVTFSTTSTSEAQRAITVHIKPKPNYVYETQHFYSKVEGVHSQTFTAYRQMAASVDVYGDTGYLAHISTTSERAAYDVPGLGVNGSYGLLMGMHFIGATRGTNDWVWVDGPISEDGTPVLFEGALTNLNTSPWDSSEPSMLTNEDYVLLFNTYVWHDVELSNTMVKGVFVEVGDSQIGSSQWDFVESETFDLDLTAPAVTAVSATSGTYVAGQTVAIKIRFDEAVIVDTTSGTPRLKIALSGGGAAYATFASGSGTNELVFSYVVAPGDGSSDLNYFDTSALELNSGSISDAAGNVAHLSLPALDNLSALAETSNVVIDGSQFQLILTASPSISSTNYAVFLLAGSVAIDCSTVTDADFTLDGISDLTITRDDEYTCRIAGTTNVQAAAYAIVSISPTISFGVNSTSDGMVAYSGDFTSNKVTVTIPAATGKGSRTERPTSGTRPSSYEAKLDTALLPAASSAALRALKSLGVVSPPAGVPELLIDIDQSAISDPDESLSARSLHDVLAGDAVSVKISVDSTIGAASKLATYVQVDGSWVFTGSQELSSGSLTTNKFVFTEPGTYYIRMFVVPATIVTLPSQYIFPFLSGNFARVSTPTIQTFAIPEGSLPAVNQQYEVVIQVSGAVPTTPPPAAPSSGGGGSLPTQTVAPTPNPTITSVPTPTASPTPTATATPVPTASSTPTASATPASTPSASATPSSTPTASATPTTSATPASTPSASATPSSTPTASTEPSTEPTETTSAQEPEPTSSDLPAPVEAVTEAVAQVAAAASEFLSSTLGIEVPVVGAPVADASIGASGDDTVIIEFDPIGTPEAVAATNKLVAATGAVVGVAAAAGAAAAAASAAAAAAGAAGAASAAGAAAGSAGAAAGSAGAAGSSSAAGAAGGTDPGASMNEDAMDAAAEAAFDLDAFEDTPPGLGDKLAILALPLLNWLDNPTRIWTRRVARFSPMLSKLINDGIYLRAIFGSISVLPTIAAVSLAVMGLIQNGSTLLHPPVPIFMAIVVLGLFDAFAGVLGVLVFVVGSIPLVEFAHIEDWRLLAGTVVAGFGPIFLARSIRNFRHKTVSGFNGVLVRIADIAFAALMGGWVAGLIFRALPALTGLTVPAANYVSTIQFYATIAIGARILIEEVAARFYPQRMDKLAPDWVPEPPKGQVVTVLVLKYFFYVFIASAFMGFGVVVWVAAALFMIPTLLEFVQDKLPRIAAIWRWLPTGIPGLAMILGLEIVLENALSEVLGDHPQFSIIFIYSLLGLIITLNIIGALGRQGKEKELRFFERPGFGWISRLGGIATFVLLVQFTSML